MKSVILLLKTVLCSVLFHCIITVNGVGQQTTLTILVENLSRPLAETFQNDILQYTVTITNTGSVSLENTVYINSIPPGTAYMPGTTTMNGNAVTDNGTNFRFLGTGYPIQANGFPSGTIPNGFAVTIVYQVRVTANAGNITNYGMIDATANGNVYYDKTSSVFTTIQPDAYCATIYQSTDGRYNDRTYDIIRVLNTTNGSSGTALNPGTFVYNGYNPSQRLNNYTGIEYTSAIGIDRTTQRIYFLNNYNGSDLCYIRLTGTPRQYCFPNTPLVTTNNVNKMTFASDGFGYALSSNNRFLVRFKQDPVTDELTITQLGSLINDPLNGSYNILTEAGGDIFGDGSGNLYLIANSNNLYKINPNNRYATYLGTVTPPPPSSSHSIAVDAEGNVYIGGLYNNVFKINLVTMQAVPLSAVPNDNTIFYSGDYASCNFPIFSPALEAIKTWENLSREDQPRGGDTIEYTIEIFNNGNINAAGVRVYDTVPSLTQYIPGSTTLNGNPVADIGGQMPFSVNNGMLVNSPGQSAGILRPTPEHKAVLKFRVEVSGLQLVCNQSRVFLMDVNGDVIYIDSHDGTTGGDEMATCFFTDGVLNDANISLAYSKKTNQHHLQWTVSNEESIASYALQLSNNGYEFNTIYETNAFHTNGIYSFIDPNHISGDARYYRIKATKTDGTVQYSTIIRVNNSIEKSMKILQNPVKTQLSMQLTIAEAGNYHFRVIDLSGKQVLQEKRSLQAGIQSVNIPFSGVIPSGVYVVEVLTSQGVWATERFMKQ